MINLLKAITSMPTTGSPASSPTVPCTLLNLVRRKLKSVILAPAASSIVRASVCCE